MGASMQKHVRLTGDQGFGDDIFVAQATRANKKESTPSCESGICESGERVSLEADMRFEELPVGSRIAIEKYDDWNRYAEAHGFFPKEIGPSKNIMLRTHPSGCFVYPPPSAPPYFRYEILIG
jgi:hypothetical protein